MEFIEVTGKTVDDAIACFANNDLCLIILDVDISVEDER